MNPEDVLRELRDTANWNAKPMVRADAFGTKRRWSPLVVTLGTIAAVAVVVTIVFSAVGLSVRGLRDPAVPPVPPHSVVPVPSPTPTGTSTPTPTGTPIPTVEPGAWTSPPAQAFGGDCNALFTREQVAQFLGVPMTALVDYDASPLRGMPSDAVVAHNGGLRCTWNDGTDQDDMEPGSHPVLSIVVLAASALPSTTSGLDCKENNGCAFSVGANGYLLGGSLGLNEAITSTMDLTTVAQGAFDGITAAFPAVTAAAGAPPAPYAARSGDWPVSIDCDTLFATSGVWSTLNRKVQAVTKPTPDYVPTLENALENDHGLTTCLSGDYGDAIYVEMLPGGAWLADEIGTTKGIHSVSVAGADKALMTTFNGGEGDYSYLWVFDGPNLMMMTEPKKSLATFQKIIPGLLATLDAAKNGAAIAPVVTTAGYGDLKLGQKVPASTSLMFWQTDIPQQCQGQPGYWQSTNGDEAFFARTEGGAEKGVLQNLLIADPSIQTRSGAHTGMTLKQLKTMFPKARVEADGKLYVVADSLGQVVFEVGDKGADEYQPGPAAKDVVLLIQVLQPDATPVPAQHGGYGPCI